MSGRGGLALRWALTCVALLVGASSPAAAQTLVSRTITVDGDMAEWHTAPSIPDNAGQSSTDCAAAEPCELDAIQSTGRDLKRFAYTWDADNLYFYVERYASSSNSNTWLFYLDENTDGLMQTGERIFQVDWWGSNRETTSHLCIYNAVGAAGDSIAGDGHTMPGTASGCTANLYTGVVKGGSLDGMTMESRLAWSALGFGGPSNIRFHISSSRGTNLPSHVEDNMVGPGGGGDGGSGGELFPPDMSIAVSASAAALDPHQQATIDVTLTNVYYTDFTDITIDVPLPAALAYAAHSAPAGTSFTDSDADGTPDTWTVPLLAGEEVKVLSITVRAAALPTGASTSTPVRLASWTGTDNEPANNADTAYVEVRPAPALAVSKSASATDALPGAEVVYGVLVTNTAEAPAHDVRIQTSLDAHVALRLDAFGPGAPLQFADGATPSNVTIAAVEFSADGGATWTYTPTSGGGGAPAGHDANVTHWRATMSGVMDPQGASFQIQYVAVAR